jgi:hypothetical protein
MLATNGPLKNLIVVENSLVDSLVAREDFQKAFPHLARLVQPRPIRPGCGRCKNRKQKATLAEYRNFKNVLATMAPEDKVRFKQFLDCKNVRVVHVNAANRIFDRTF